MNVRVIAKLLLFFSTLFLVTAPLLVSGCGGSPPSISIEPVQNTAPILSISVTPAAVLPGQSATLTWTTTSAVSCVADGSWSGSRQMSGSMSVTLGSPATQTYALECNSASGQTTRKSVTLALSPSEGSCTTKTAVVAAARRHIGKRRAHNGGHS